MREFGIPDLTEGTVRRILDEVIYDPYTAFLRHVWETKVRDD